MYRKARILGLVASAILVTSAVEADIVATFGSTPGPPFGSTIHANSSGAFCQRYHYDNQNYTVFGNTVNFSTDVGDVFCNASTVGMTVTADCQSDSYGVGGALSMMGITIPAGPATLPAPGTPLPFLVTLPSTLVMGTVPALLGTNLTYVFDGAHTQEPSGLPATNMPGCAIPGGVAVLTGSGSISAFAPEPTATGSSVSVSTSPVILDPVSMLPRQTTIDITFDDVSVAGDTLVTAFSRTNLPIAPYFAFELDGYAPVFLDVSSTATFSGPITVCQHYADDDDDGVVDGTTLSEGTLKLLHGEPTGVPPVLTYVDRTVSHDLDANVVCAQVDDLSPFVLAVDVDLDDDNWLDTEDPCRNTGTQNITVKPRLLIKKTVLDTTPDDEQLLLKGEYVSATAFGDLHPDVDGVRIVLATADLTPIADIVVPGGAGWSGVSGKSFAFVDPSGANNGIVKVQLKDRSKKAPDQVRVKVTGKNGSYPVPFQPFPLPIRAVVITGDGGNSECAELPVPSACDFNGPGTGVICR
jgi:hypothetical protein